VLAGDQGGNGGPEEEPLYKGSNMNWRIHVPRAHHDTLCSSDVWFFDPTEYQIEPGDTVDFCTHGQTIQRARVLGMVDPADYPKFCSSVNSQGFHWIPIVSEPITAVATEE
jgi:hypothetical protein